MKNFRKKKKKIYLKLTSSENIFLKHAARANFVSVEMFNNLFATRFATNSVFEELVLNGPICAGMSIQNNIKMYIWFKCSKSEIVGLRSKMYLYKLKDYVLNMKNY